MSARRNVLVVARHPVGGIKTYFKYVYTNELFREFNFTLIVPRADDNSYFFSVFEGGEFQCIETDVTHAAFISSIIRALASGKYDLLHTHGFTAGLLSALPARMTRVPHIMTAHDVLLPWQFRGLKGRAKKAVIGGLFQLIDVLMAVGQDARQNLEANYPWLTGSRKLAAVRNGIDVERFRVGSKRDLKAELGLAPDTILFGFFGRFMSQKGFRYLVDAVELIKKKEPSLNLKVATFGWGGFIREEQQAIKERGLESSFYFMPHTDDMPAAIRGVDAVVMPSQWEACPLLPMEAMVAGVPVIGSDCIGLNEVLLDTPARIFKSGDVNTLVDALLDFTQNRDLFISTARTFVGEASARFDCQISAEGLMDLYESALALGKVVTV